MPLLKAREILASGTWPGSETFSVNDEDLQSIVESFDALKLSGRVPLKLGHDGPDVRFDDNPLRQFALGWVTKLWREGSRLLADLDVPAKVKQVIDEGYLKFVSVELLKNVQAFNRTIPLVLDAVALLGTDQPAVGVLKDLQSLTLTRRSTLRAGARVSLSTRGSRSEETEMTPEEIQKMIDKATQPLTVKLTAVEGELKTEKDAREKAEKETKVVTLKFKRESIDREFNTAIEDKLIDPKVREQYVKLTRYDKDDHNLDEIKIEDVKEFIKDAIKPGTVKASAKQRTAGGESATDEDADKPADIRLANRTRKLCATRNIKPEDYAAQQRIAMEVLRDDPELAKAYQTQQPVKAKADDKGGN